MDFLTWSAVFAAFRSYFLFALPLLSWGYGFLVMSLILYWWVSLAPAGRNFGGVMGVFRTGRSFIWGVVSYGRLVSMYWSMSAGKGRLARTLRRAGAAHRSGRDQKQHSDTFVGVPPDNMQSEARAAATPGLDDLDFIRRHG